jgi:hypothetical protein
MLHKIRSIFPKIFLRRFFSSQVELTSVRYKDHVKRGDFATLTEGHISFFEGLLGKPRVLTDPSDLEQHNTDWLRIVRGRYLGT